MDVAIYARLSQEDDAARTGEATATQRQIADCQGRATREGWRVAAIYEDPDHSASDLRRARPDFQRMLADLGDGLRVDAVLTYKLDRLLRHPKEAEQIIDLADARQFGIVSLNDPGIDLTSPTGRAMFRMSITWAKLETETTALRVRRKAREIAETGRPNGGGIRSFGLTADKLRTVPEEAALVREAADRILAGESVHSIVVDWLGRDIRTPAGRKWEASSLKRMLTAPRIAGDRSHHGLVVGTGVIPALLGRETWDRLRAVLSARNGPTGARVVRRHVLTGLAVCGRCDAKLVARPDARGVTRYCCMAIRGCGALVVAAKYLEPLVIEALMQRLDSPAFRAALEARVGRTETSVDLARLRGDEDALAEASEDYYVRRTLPKPEYQRVREALERRIEAARRKLNAASSTAGLARVAGINVRSEWERRPVTWRHELVALFVARIVVNPAPRRGTRFDPLRVDVEWRDVA